MTDKLRAALRDERVKRIVPVVRNWMQDKRDNRDMEEVIYAALAAAPQPAPDRETLESIIYNSADAYIEEHDRRAIADALLARGLRLPGGDETMAWAVVGEDGEVIPGSIYPTRDEAERVCDYDGERVVRVAIRVVEGGDDAA